MKQDYYLYNNSYKLTVGTIAKENEKSFRMSDGTRIPKEEFEDRTYKLSNKEVEIYRGELIKKLSPSYYQVNEMISSLKKLYSAITYTPFVEVNVTKLQGAIDNLELQLRSVTPQPMPINNKTYEFSYNTDLDEVGEDVRD